MNNIKNQIFWGVLTLLISGLIAVDVILGNSTDIGLVILLVFVLIGFFICSLSNHNPDLKKYVLLDNVEYMIRKARAEAYEAGENYAIKKLQEEILEESKKFLMGFAYRPMGKETAPEKKSKK